ncbi:MAG: calcium-binding protein, partial [Candidatus Nitrotoga sp.]
LNKGTDKVNSSVTYTLSANVENLTLTGTLAINGTGNNLDNVITGNSAANQLNGQAGNDKLIGGGGDDTLTGGSGVDTMIGGLGNDSYFVENAGDVVTEYLNQGTDTVSSRLTYTLPANLENLILTGTLAINGTGNNLANVIIGNTAANQLDGGLGDDTLDGGLSNNGLTGGAGNDSFRFTTTGHVDTITDYNVANDTIQLENGVFTALTTTGTLAAGQFRIGTQAVDANDFIIYNNATGALLYDANGNGAGAAVQIATIGVGLAMTNAEFVII